MTPHSPDNDKDTPLSVEDKRLWDDVTRTVEPVHPPNTRPCDPSKKTDLKKNRPKTSTAAPPQPTRDSFLPRHSQKPPQKPQSREVDARTAQRLRRGQIPIDVHLDLHGMIQETAHRHLVQTVTRAYQQNQRLVLVITGKGSRSQEGGGILRRRVPEWCTLSPLAEIILNITNARPRHGGEGAYYIFLRRKRGS
ncbi:MAG: Smr/MutS family protein [Pseudomonadota bacterium]